MHHDEVKGISPQLRVMVHCRAEYVVGYILRGWGLF